ncbi:MAG: hypothetical protein K2N88_03895 [Muribaculaceae bacterium]|nr:hypothetical protein [Muribaculaceae bacterium]
MKQFTKLSVLALACLSLAACEKDETNNPDPVIPGAPTAAQGIYALTEGQFYSGIPGGLDVITFAPAKIENNVFSRTNGRSIGDTPQCGVAYGSKIYVGTSESNTIEILDRFTWKSIMQIRLADITEGGQPYSMVADHGKVFVSLFGGNLARLDTLTLSIDKVVAVGPNPDHIALYNDKIYVPISDGMNYPNYGRTAVVVNPKTMAIEKTFDTYLNPREFFVVGGRLFLLCMGDYSAANPSQLFEVDAQYGLRKICNATIAAPYGRNIAIINQPFVQNEEDAVLEYKLYDLNSGTLSDWEIERPDYANNMHYDAEADRMMISSYVMNGKYPSYEKPGYVNVYKSQERTPESKFNLGSAGRVAFFTLTK